MLFRLVERLEARSSDAPMRVKIWSMGPIWAASAGTKLPVCAMRTMWATSLLADVQRAQAVLVHMALLVSMMAVMVIVVPGRMVRTSRGCRRQQDASHGQPQRVASGNSRSSGLAGPKGKGMFRSMFHQGLLMGNLPR